MSDTWDQFKPATAAPVTTPVAPAAAPWDQFKSVATSQAMSKAAVSANDSPDDAGRALTISKQTGIPASIVQTDLPGYDAHAKTEAAKSATANPAISKYIDSHPLAATVSNDDWAHLDQSSPVFQDLSADAIHNESHRQIVNNIPELADMLSTAAGRSKLNDAINTLPATLWQDVKDTATAASMGIVQSALAPVTLAQQKDLSFFEGFARQFDPRPKIYGIGGALGLGFSPVLGAVKTLAARPLAIATGLPLDQVEEAVNTSLFGLGAKRGSVKPGLPKTIDEGPPSFGDALRTARDKADIDEFLRQRSTGNFDANKFTSPELKAEVARYKPGEPVPDPVVQAKAEVAGAAIDEAVQVAQESKTKARSPELYEEYIKAHGDDGTVHVPAQSILDLYDREKKVPIAGDGLFGFVPGILDKATLAAETGAEVKIPISKYVANIDPAVHEGLKDSVRVHEDGVTREEAKAAIEANKAKIEAYHGTPHDFENFDLTKIGTGEGAQVYGHGLYFAEQKAVATDYQKNLSGDMRRVNGELIDFDNPLHVAANQKKIYGANAIPDLEKQIATVKSHAPKAAGIYEKALEILKGKDAIPDVTTDTGQLYKVHISADPQHFLDWDKPFGEQAPHIQERVKALQAQHDLPFNPELNSDVVTGEQIYGHLKDVLATHKKGVPDKNEFYKTDDGRVAASKALAEAGIPGIKYLDQGSRFDGLARLERNVDIYRSDFEREPNNKYVEERLRASERELEQEKNKPQTRNFVVFDDKLVKIIEKNDNPVVQAAVEATIKAKQSLYLEPLFKDGSALNVTQTEFKQYSNLIDRAQENILTKAVVFAKREVSKRLTPEWKANEAREREAVSQELYDSPVWQADRFFNTDKGLLPGDGPRTPKDAVPTLDMIKSDDWAPIFGFESGIDMTTALLAHEAGRADAGKGPKWQFKQQVDAATAARMEAKHGHLQDNIALEASEAALADYNVDLLAAEWKLLANHNGVEPPLSRAELTTWARDQFDRSIASEVSYEQWRRAAEKGGREAEKALLKGDFKEAFAQKQKQMLSFLLAKEAKGFEKEVDKAERLFDKYASEVNLPAVDQRYTDQVHRLLQQYGIETKRTTENTDYNLQGKDLATFIQDRNANGDLIVQANLPTPRPGSNRPIDQFTVDQYRDFATMIKSLDHNGRAAKKIEIAGKKEDFNNVIDKIAKNLDTLEKSDFDPAARGPISGLRKLGRAIDSRLLKAEKLIDWIDKKDPLGAFNSSVLRGLIEGEQGKGDMITKLAGMAKELPGDRAWGKGLNDATTNKELMDWETGKPMQLSNENKIAIALNYGNKSNRRVMLEGYKWTEAEVEAYLARELTLMDKAMVDGIHGLFEPLAPLVEKTTANRAGVAIPLVEGTPTLGMKGGYYPLIEDPRAKLLGQQVTTDLFQKTNFDPLPTANALKQRTGKVYPIDLSISQIHSRLSQTAHAVFMQEPVVNANKVISDPFVREGIAKAFGPEYVEMLDKWVRDIANNGGADDDRMAAWLSRNLRQNVVVQLMGWKASTALIHGGSAGASSVYELGKMDMDTTGNPGRSFMLAPARLVQNIYNLGLGQFLPNAARRMFGSQSGVFDAVDFVMNNSGEMRNRTRSLQKDFGFQLDKITNSSLFDDAAKLRAVHQTYSMAMVSYLDQLTATPVWKAAYDKATVTDGMEHEDAVYVADKAVREAHGSASLVSRANIGRGEVNKWLTIAYNGYWNHNYNKMREAGKEVGGYDDSLSNWQRIAIGAAFMSAMIIAPALVHHAVRGEESKTTGGAIANMMVSQFGGTVPVVNALTYSIMHNRDPSVSPIEEVLKSVTTLGQDAMKVAPFIGSGKPVLHPVKDAAKAVGFLTGLPPTNQVIDTFSFINDVVNRKEDPKTTQEWARGLMMGHAKAKAR